MADGTIRVETKIDTSGAKADLEKMQKMCVDTKKNIEQATLNLGFKVKPVQIFSNSDLNKAKKRLEEIAAEIAAIQSQTDKDLQLAATDEQAAALLDMEKNLTQDLLAEQESLNLAVEEYEKAQERITAEKQRQKDLAEAEKEKNNAISDVNKEVNASAANDDFISRIQTVEQYNNALADTESRMCLIEQRTAQLAMQKGVDPESALEANGEYQKLKNRLDALQNTTKKFKSESKDAFQTAKKHAADMGNGIKSAIGQMAKYTLAIFGARNAFYAVKSAIRQAVSENEQLNNTVTAIKGLLASALAPAVERVVYYIQYGLAYLNLFIKTLTGVDLVANYNAKALKKQAEATKQAGKAAKEAKNQLASFDEKNMLGSTNNSASKDTTAIENAANENAAKTLDLPDVAGGKFEKICQSIKANIGEIEAFLGGALIAVGMILLVCGQIPLGIAAIVAGIALEALAIKNSNTMADKTKVLLNTIMIIAGGALLAIGLILCTTPATLQLGIALVAAGAALIIGAVALKVNEMPENARRILNLIMGIAGAALLAIGVILIMGFSTVPLGIALIAAGAAMLASAVVLAVNAMPDKVRSILMLIGGIASAALLVLGIILCATGVHLMLGVALIAAGAAGLVTVLALNKDVIKNWVSGAWNSVKSFWNAHIRPVFTKKFWMDKLQALPDGAKLAINVVLQTIENALNWITNGLNRIQFNVPDWVPGIGGYRMGFNFSPVRLPRLQYGGVVNAPGRGQALIAGEAGAEAILPLTNNTEWMDILADKVVDKMGKVPIINKFIVNDKTVFAEYKKSQAAFNFATNGGVL